MNNMNNKNNINNNDDLKYADSMINIPQHLAQNIQHLGHNVQHMGQSPAMAVRGTGGGQRVPGPSGLPGGSLAWTDKAFRDNR